MRRAKHGNQRSLFKLFMGEGGQEEAAGEQSFELMYVPAGGDSVDSNFGTMIQSAEYPAEGQEHGDHHDHRENKVEAEAEAEVETVKQGSAPFSSLDHEIDAGQFFEDVGSFESMGVGEVGEPVGESIDKEQTRAEGARHHGHGADVHTGGAE